MISKRDRSTNLKNNAGAGDARNARTARDVDISQSAELCHAVWQCGAVTDIGGGPPKASPP